MENSAKLKLRDRVFNTVSAKSFTIGAIAFLVIIMFVVEGLGVIPGLVLSLFILWASRWKWSFFGIGKLKWKDTILKTIFYTLAIFILIDTLATPLTEKIFNSQIDYSSFEWLEGNLGGLLIYLPIVYLIAAFGEEFVYRGYIMKQMARLFGNSKNAWIIALIISSAMFGFVHFYQGIVGVISTGLTGLIFGIAFLRNKENLTLCMLIHALSNTIGLVLIYLGKARILEDWVLQNIFTF